MLAGAAVQTGTASNRAMTGGVNISVAGGLSFGVAYTLDGAMHNDVNNNANLPMPFPDALQEFSVATSGLSAQNGMHAGASVNAVTKSGTNQLHGNAFEFVRDKRFNAKDPFAAIDPATGERKDDGLVRNQFGGTLGGPIVRDKLFFFGGYQGTEVSQTPAANITYVPTAAMLAGDFTTFASAACQGRDVALRGGFVNNRISPSAFSPAAVNMAKRLPTTTDPCGQITYSIPDDSREGDGLGRADYQHSANHSIFGRYMFKFAKKDPPYKTSQNVLTTTAQGIDNLYQGVGDRRHDRVRVECGAQRPRDLQPHARARAAPRNGSRRTTSGRTSTATTPARCRSPCERVRHRRREQRHLQHRQLPGV